MQIFRNAIEYTDTKTQSDVTSINSEKTIAGFFSGLDVKTVL